MILVNKSIETRHNISKHRSGHIPLAKFNINTRDVRLLGPYCFLKFNNNFNYSLLINTVIFTIKCYKLVNGYVYFRLLKK